MSEVVIVRRWMTVAVLFSEYHPYSVSVSLSLLRLTMSQVDK